MKEVLAGNIARYRKENKLTQEELGNQLGVTYQAVSKWENGQTMPDIAILPGLARVLQVSLDKLFGYPAPVPSFYESVYRSREDYYWGVAPSAMCIRLLELMPPVRRLRLLDIGCGEGKNAVFLARCGYDVSAFDLADAGLEKAARLSQLAGVQVKLFKADVWDYRLEESYDILFSSGVFHCLKAEQHREIFDNYRRFTNPGGLHAFNVFVRKPFIAPPPEKEEHFHPWYSGQLLTYYHDWLIEGFSETIFDCYSSGVPHKHAMNEIYARRPAAGENLSKGE